MRVKPMRFRQFASFVVAVMIALAASAAEAAFTVTWTETGPTPGSYVIIDNVQNDTNPAAGQIGFGFNTLGGLTITGTSSSNTPGGLIGGVVQGQLNTTDTQLVGTSGVPITLTLAVHDDFTNPPGSPMLVTNRLTENFTGTGTGSALASQTTQLNRTRLPRPPPQLVAVRRQTTSRLQRCLTGPLDHIVWTLW